MPKCLLLAATHPIFRQTVADVADAITMLSAVTEGIMLSFYSTPSTEGVESTRGNSVCLSVCVSVRNHFFLLRIFNDLMV